MNPLFIPSLLIAATSMTSAILIPFFGHKKIHWLWSIFNLLVAFWGFGLLGTSLSNNPATATFWLKILQAAGGLIPVAYCHFSAEFAGLNKNKFIKISYFLGLILSTYTVIGLIHTKTELIRDSFYYVRSTDWTYFVITFYFLIYTIYGGSLLCKSLNTTNEENRIQAKILIISTFIGFLAGTVSHFFTVHRIFNYPEINIFVTIYILLPTYAIFRYKLFGLEFVLKKSLVYTLLVSIITGAYFLILILIEKLFQKSLGYNSLLFTLIIFGFIIVSAEPLRIKIQALMDHWFFKGSFVKIVEERDRLHIQILQQDRLRAVATLAAGMAHEIKNPLTSIKTFAEYLPKKYDDPEFREKFSRIVVDEVDRVNNIVRQLLEFSKPSELDLKPILISDLLDQTVSLLNNNLLRYHIQLTKNFDPYAIILADRNQLKQAFLNIFLNSIQSMTGGGQLTVISRKEADGQVKTTISDTGCGVTSEQLAHVFDPFYTTKEDGTGLGLAIVHGIIVKHGGKIWMESAPGKWTTVSVILKSQS